MVIYIFDQDVVLYAKLMFRGGIPVTVMQYIARSFASAGGNRCSSNLGLQLVEKFVGRKHEEHTR